jgi:hypothetical protein
VGAPPRVREATELFGRILKSYVRQLCTPPKESQMQLDLAEKERDVLRTALEIYVSDLRQEIVKTEKYELRQTLHEEADILKHLIERLS